MKTNSTNSLSRIREAFYSARDAFLDEIIPLDHNHLSRDAYTNAVTRRKQWRSLTLSKQLAMLDNKIIGFQTALRTAKACNIFGFFSHRLNLAMEYRKHLISYRLASHKGVAVALLHKLSQNQESQQNDGQL